MLMIRYPLRRLPCRFGSTRTQIRNHGDQRFFSTKPDDIAPEASQKTRSRLERVNGRLPLFLQRYTKPLLTAPLTHVSSFLLLHELTAIVPLIGLIATFHYTHWLPPYISQGEFFSKTVEKTGTYMRKKGWLGEEGKTRRNKWWSLGEGGSRIATAWLIVKAFLPLRIPLSFLLTPWFARVAIVPSVSLFRRSLSKMVGRAPKSSDGGSKPTAAGALSKTNSKP
ncbi:MAG: hypothetical protein L6R40_007021 [Gallowayella cf. fulva]|nr:MAG: hypothetical protein L6R40_007021 [Xanthomendoza cf. fulva]